MEDEPQETTQPNLLYAHVYAVIDPAHGTMDQEELAAKLQELGCVITHIALNEPEPLPDSWRFDMDVEKLLSHRELSDHRKAASRGRLILARLGADNVRDLLVIGQQKFRKLEGSYKLGPATWYTLQQAMTIALDAHPTVRWLNWPTASFAARICNNLSDVTALTVVPLDVINRGPHTAVSAVPTVHDLLTMTEEEIATHVNSHAIQDPHAEAVKIKTAALLFARDFTEAKQAARRGINIAGDTENEADQI